MIGYSTKEEADKAAKKLEELGLPCHADQDIQRFGNQWILILDKKEEEND